MKRFINFLKYFLHQKQKQKNRVIWLKVGSEVPMFALAVNVIPDLLPQGGSQCFPFYTYNEDGTNRQENITDWALEQFRTHYNDTNILKWDIFHYVYAVLHHPQYREKDAPNLKRELPRIPFTLVHPGGRKNPFSVRLDWAIMLPYTQITLPEE